MASPVPEKFESWIRIVALFGTTILHFTWGNESISRIDEYLMVLSTLAAILTFYVVKYFFL